MFSFHIPFRAAFRHPFHCLYRIPALLILLALSFSLTGCHKNELPATEKELDFTVVAGTDIPAELQELIDERLKDPFELTYSDGTCLYIVKGYGCQQTEGYNITVNNFYQSADGLVFDTELTGPHKNEEISQSQTYPYIVIKTEFIDAPVTFS